LEDIPLLGYRRVLAFGPGPGGTLEPQRVTKMSTLWLPGCVCTPLCGAQRRSQGMVGGRGNHGTPGQPRPRGRYDKQITVPWSLDNTWNHPKADKQPDPQLDSATAETPAVEPTCTHPTSFTVECHVSAAQGPVLCPPPPPAPPPGLPTGVVAVARAVAGGGRGPWCDGGSSRQQGTPAARG